MDQENEGRPSRRAINETSILNKIGKLGASFNRAPATNSRPRLIESMHWRRSDRSILPRSRILSDLARCRRLSRMLEARSVRWILEIYDYASTRVRASQFSTGQKTRREEENLCAALSFSLSLSLLVHALSARVRCVPLLTTGSTSWRIGLQVQHHLSVAQGNSVLRILRERGVPLTGLLGHVFRWQ